VHEGRVVSLCVTDVVLDGAPVGLRAVDGAITALGPDVTAAPDDDILDGHGHALVPGLVNGHGHAAMTLLRGYGDDLPLMRWLETRIWPAEARLTREDVYWGTRLACLEMLRAGTTRFWDMYWFQFEVARAVVDSGMRATVSQVFLSFEGAPDEARPEAAPDGLDRLATFGPRVTPSLGPHAIYTVDEPTLRVVAELSATRGVPVQIHLSETEAEVTDCVAAHGCRPAEYLDRLGLLTERTVLAHGVWLDDAELALVAERGATIVTNPVSNMKLAVGRAFPYGPARAAGVPIGIGTDGAASNNSLDLLGELKVLTLLQKHTAVDAAVLPAADGWAIATGAAAPALGGTPVAVGAPADFALVDTTTPELAPAPLVDGLVYGGSGAVVQTVVVAGSVLMRDRRVDAEDEIRDRATAAARRVRGD
jgi:5-methylthioadenosine/S-adenosylhomocysteine deaminase